MAVVPKDILLDVASEANAPQTTIHFQEAATQTFVNGELVYIDSDGFCYEIGGATPAVIMGVANENSHNDVTAGTHTVSVTLANGINIFEANCLQTALGDHVLVQADIGTFMGIQRDTTNSRTFLDASVKNANSRVLTLAIGQNSALGDTNARLLFIFQPKFAQSLSSS
jgi:hypothetical protein